MKSKLKSNITNNNEEVARRLNILHKLLITIQGKMKTDYENYLCAI
jgi:hypothetical protein